MEIVKKWRGELRRGRNEAELTAALWRLLECSALLLLCAVTLSVLLG